MISADRQAQILRYYHVEKWRINTIAVQLRVHHTTVQRVLAQAGVPRAAVSMRASAVDAFVPMIVQTLERFPTLTAARLYGMARERGYAGSAGHFRHRVALLRPRRAAEAYLRLRTLPGEQAQVDWGHFGHLVIGCARRPLMAFVMVPSYSRTMFLRFFESRRRGSWRSARKVTRRGVEARGREGIVRRRAALTHIRPLTVLRWRTARKTCKRRKQRVTRRDLRGFRAFEVPRSTRLIP